MLTDIHRFLGTSAVEPEIGGVTDTGSILDKIVLERREGVEARKQRESEADLRSRFDSFDAQWGLTRAITTPRGNAPAEAAIQIIREGGTA